MTSPTTGPVDRKNTINNWAQEKDFFTRWTFYPPEPQLVGLIESLTPQSLIDLGCGGAPYLKLFHEKGCRVLGCDINAQAVQAQQRVLPSGRVLQEDLFTLSTKETFDVGLLRGVLEYYTHADQIRFVNENAAKLITRTLIVEETVVDKPETRQDHRGLTMYFTAWAQMAATFPGWQMRIVDKSDPYFLGRYMQTQIPGYKISDHVSQVKYILFTKAPL